MTGKRDRTKISPRELQVLNFVSRFIRENEYPPSIQEIIDNTDSTSKSVVNYYLVSLEKSGYIRRIKKIARGIVIL